VNPKQKNTFEGYRGLYLERSGESARHLVETLMAPPEIPLDDNEKAAAYEFEASISGHVLYESDNPKDTVTIEDVIRSQKGEALSAPLFFAESFLDGSVDLSVLGNPEFHSHEDVYKWIATAVHDGTIPVDTLRSAAKQSFESYQQKIARSLIDSEMPVDKEFDSLSIVIQPETIVEQSKNSELTRRYLLDLRTNFKEGGQPLDGAKRALIDVYLGRLNEVIAKNIPVADYLIHQSEMIGDEEGAQAIKSVLPSSVRSMLESNEMKRSLFKRLDYLRNGLAVNEEGESTALSGELLTIPPEAVETNETAAIFTPEQVAILKNTMVSPDEMQTIFSRILGRAGQLSQEDPETWTSKRKVRAADGLFQVIKNPGKLTFEVDGTSGVYKVASEPRSLYDVLVVGGFHELSHINQAQADKRMGEVLRIAAVKGKRPSMIREGGANMKQRAGEQKLFGVSKPIALTYARALHALEHGGNLFDAVKAFYDEKRHIMPEVSEQKAAKEAADRVLRLVRQGGQNSLAMSYAEEGILIQELAGASSDMKERAVAVTGLDLVDQVRLHKYDLLPEVSDKGIDWSNLILEELAPYIDNALEASA
jgi:hypothetical protein